MTLYVEPGSIVCGIDGSADADRALHWAAEQASLEHRPIAVVSAAGVDQVAALSWAGATGTLVIPTDELVKRVRAVAESGAVSTRDKRANSMLSRMVPWGPT